MKSKILNTIVLMMIGFLCISQESNVYSADAFFNQGNVAFNAGQYGEAIYQYEKALLLDPNSDDIKVNLRLAVERLDSDIIELDPFFLSNWWKSLSNLFLPGIWKLISIFFLILLIGLVFLHLFKSKLSPKLIYSLGVGFIFLIMISILAGSTRANSIFENKYAVLNGNVESFYEGPDLVSEKIKPVVNGVKVKILDSNSEWYKVAAMDSEHGWVLKNNVRLLKFAK